MVAEYLRGMRGYDLLSFFDFFLAFAFYNGIVYMRVFSDRFSTHKKKCKRSCLVSNDWYGKNGHSDRGRCCKMKSTAAVIVTYNRCAMLE